MSQYVTFEDLVRFHKEVIAPDLDARLAPLVREIVSLRGEMEHGFQAVQDNAQRNHLEVLGHFDQLYSRLEGMAVEYTALKGGLRRVEKRLSKVDGSTN